MGIGPAWSPFPGLLPLAFLAMLTLPPEPITAQEELRAFVGAHLLPIVGPEVEDGVLLLRGTRIQLVGPRSEVATPTGAQVHDLTGRWLMPGLVDSHSQLGRGNGGDRSSPLHPDVRTLDALVRAEFLKAREYRHRLQAAEDDPSQQPARILCLDHRVGSLKPGKDGDPVLFEGDPFEYATRVCGVIIEGEVVSRECR